MERSEFGVRVIIPTEAFAAMQYAHDGDELVIYPKNDACLALEADNPNTGSDIVMKRAADWKILEAGAMVDKGIDISARNRAACSRRNIVLELGKICVCRRIEDDLVFHSGKRASLSRASMWDWIRRRTSSMGMAFDGSCALTVGATSSCSQLSIPASRSARYCSPSATTSLSSANSPDATFFSTALPCLPEGNGDGSVGAHQKLLVASY